MDGWELKEALEAKRRVYGTMFVTARTGRWDHTIGVVELDFVIVDNEHAPYSRAETADWVAKLSQLGIVPFIRVPVPQSHYVTMAVDEGAQGILAPYVETVDQVREVVAAAKYRPLKGEAARRVVEEGVFPSKETQRHSTTSVPTSRSSLVRLTVTSSTSKSGLPSAFSLTSSVLPPSTIWTTPALSTVATPRESSSASRSMVSWLPPPASKLWIMSPASNRLV